MIYKLNVWKKEHNIIKYKNPIIVNNREQLIKLVKENKDKYFDSSFNIHNHHNNLLEYCIDEKYIKLWFDIDMIKIEFNDLQNALTEFFDLIDKVVGKKLNRNSYYIYYKKLPNKSYTHSLRIINWYYKISYDDNEALTNELLEHKNNILSKNLDVKVYHKERQIILPYNSKILTDKYEKHKNIFFDLKNNDSNSHFFVDYNYKDKNKSKIQTINVLNYLISYIGNCKEQLIFTTEKNEIEKKELFLTDDKDVDYSKRQKKLFDNDNIIDVLINHLDNKFYTAKYGKKWIGLLKLLKTLRLKDIQKFLIYSVENTDKLDYTIDRNKEFYEKLDYNANNNNFRIKNYGNSNNIICNYLNNFQEKYEFYTQEYLCNINDLSLWISGKIQKTENKELYNYDNIYIVLNEYKQKYLNEKCIYENFKITDTIEYNYKTGYLYGLNELYNYYVENQYYNMFLSNDNDNNFDIIEDELIINNTLNENILNEVNKFINYENRLLVLAMKWGTGKTYHITKRLLKKIFECDNNKNINDYLNHIKNIDDDKCYLNFNDVDIPYYEEIRNLKRQIIISPNNSLNIKEQQELKQEDGNCFTNHIDINKLKEDINKINDKLYKNPSQQLEDKLKILNCKKQVMCRYLNNITSLQSIDNISITDYNSNTKTYEINKNSIDTTYLDEFNTLMNNFNLNGNTFKGKKNNEDNIKIQKIEYNINHLINICKISKRIIILDADINFVKLNWFLNKIGKENAKKIKVNYNKFTAENYKLNFYDTEDGLEQQLLLKQNIKKEICCVSKNKAIDIFKSLICECFDNKYNLIKSDKVIGLLDGDGFNYFDAKNIEQSILSKKLFEYTEDDKNEITQSNKELIKCEMDCKFLNIVKKYNLKWCNDNITETKKEELLYNYEKCITEIYKFTDFIRTPTIKCGISFNSCYFDEVFIFIYIGILTTEEILQMFWRSRNTKNKIIHIGFTNKQSIRKYEKLISYDWISDKIDIQSYNSSQNNNYLTKYDEKEFELIKSNNLKELIKLNEYDAINSSNRFTQMFFNLLFYHGFKLNEHIFFIKLNKSNDIIDKNKFSRVELQHNTFLNISILDLTKNKLDEIDYNKKNNLKLNNDYRNKHNKYLKLNMYLQFEPLYIYFWLMNNYEDYKKKQIEFRDDIIRQLEDYDDNELNEGTIIFHKKQLKEYNNKIKLLKTIDKSGIINIIQKQNEEIYNNIINDIKFYDMYGIENYNCSIITSYSQIKRLIKNSNNTEIYETKKSITEDIRDKRDNLLRTLLVFLDIDIKKDYNKDSLKRIIIKNDKDKKICGFVNDILSNTNIKEFDGESICFLLWLEKFVLDDYKKSNVNIKIKETKLDAIKNLKLIKKIINYYLNELNLYFNYENQIEHNDKLYNNLQFIITKMYKINISNKPLFNKYYYGNEKIIKELNNNETIIYKKEFFKNDNDGYFVNNDRYFVNKDYIFVNDDVNEYNNKNMTIIYKDINKTEIIQDNLIIKPLSIINEKEVYEVKTKNKKKVKKYYDNNIEVIKEEYTSYDNVNNKLKKYRFINKKNNDKINEINNYINRKIHIKTKMVLDKDIITDNIMKNNNNSNEVKDILDNIVNQVIINNELEYMNLDANNSIVTINKKQNLLNELLINDKPTPIIIYNENDYINNFLNNISQIIEVN